MKNPLLIIFIVMIGIGFTNCGLFGGDSKPLVSGEGTPAPPEGLTLAGDCCLRSKARIICVKDTDPQKAVDVARQYLYSTPQDGTVERASFYFLSFGNKLILAGCMQKFGISSAYSFFPPGGSACHSLDDRCLTVKEDWIKIQESKNFSCVPFSIEEDSYVCLDEDS